MLHLRHYFAFFLIFFCLSLVFSCRKTSGPLPLKSGMHISQSVTIKPDTFLLQPLGPDSTLITISGDDLTIDFNGAVIQSAAPITHPDQFWGTGIRITKGKNIRIKNVTVRGFKIGLLATNCDSLQLSDSDFSYNYRPKLSDTAQDQSGDWQQQGAAVYLENCRQAVVKNIHITGGQNGVWVDNCQQGLFYNNTIQYNSGIGIGLSRSSNNWLMHNRLDWNVREEFADLKKQTAAAGILATQRSNDNVFAYNSATHSGQGILLQANPPCNNNLIFGNDFSHAAHQGIALFSGSNNIIYNQLEDCHIGIGAEQIHHSLLLGNRFRENDQDLSINADSSNLLRDNVFDQTDTDLAAVVAQYAPEPLADGQAAFLAEGSLRGRQYILQHEWGPYDFRYPALWLRTVEGSTYTFVILGPQGNWQSVGGSGVKQLSRKRGAVPATIVAEGEKDFSLELKFIGAEAKTVFGESVKKGKGILFGWK